MIDFLYSIDVAIFHFINNGLSSAAGDFLWPLVTDYDKILVVRIALIAVWLWLVIKGGKRGRTVAFLVIVVIFCSDQLSSFVVKPLLARPRPCQTVDGVPAVADVHLLVGCGGGKSFPSSHAVNNFAVATLFGLYYKRTRYALFAFASVVALSRVFVGVHYPSDILGGALIGMLVGWLVVTGWQAAARQWIPQWAVDTAGQSAP
jgi:undecaprenyl-diphosphatase